MTEPRPEWVFPQRNALTRAKLDPMGCAAPNCDHDHSELYLVQKCHPKVGVDAKYVKDTGQVVITCHACDELVAVLQVADGTVPPK